MRFQSANPSSAAGFHQVTPKTTVDEGHAAFCHITDGQRQKPETKRIVMLFLLSHVGSKHHLRVTWSWHHCCMLLLISGRLGVLMPYKGFTLNAQRKLEVLPSEQHHDVASSLSSNGNRICIWSSCCRFLYHMLPHFLQAAHQNGLLWKQTVAWVANINTLPTVQLLSSWKKLMPTLRINLETPTISKDSSKRRAFPTWSCMPFRVGKSREDQLEKNFRCVMIENIWFLQNIKYYIYTCNIHNMCNRRAFIYGHVSSLWLVSVEMIPSYYVLVTYRIYCI